MTTTNSPETAASTGPAGLPDRSDYGPAQLAAWLGLDRWQVEAASASAGLLPAPDCAAGRRWSAEVARRIAGRLPDIVAAVGTEPPIGARRAADRLAAQTGEEIQPRDVEGLASAGLLTAVAEYKGHPLYAPAAVDALRDVPGLLDRIAADRLLGPDQAAELLGIRRTDWDHVVAAGWIAPCRHASMEVGRRRSVSVPLYRTAEVRALLEVPGVDWEEVRAVAPGARSPLRAYAEIPPTRARVIRSWVAALGERYGIEVWAWFDGRTGRWAVDWDPKDGRPAVEDVRADLAAYPPLVPYAGSIRLSCDAGAAIRWARSMLAPGAAVILDTETTDLDGVVIEISAIDAATGATLLDTLVDPGGEPISPGAYAVHGISAVDLAGAPAWREVLPELLRVTRGRHVLAYNADFDSDRIAQTTRRDGLDPGHLADPGRWGCVMNRRSDWARVRRWLPLGGAHRSLGDAHAAREVLLAMSSPGAHPR